ASLAILLSAHSTPLLRVLFPDRRSSDLSSSKTVRARRALSLTSSSAVLRRFSTSRAASRTRASARDVENLRKTAELEVKESALRDRKSTRLNSSHVSNSYAVLCLKRTKH